MTMARFSPYDERVDLVLWDLVHVMGILYLLWGPSPYPQTVFKIKNGGFLVFFWPKLLVISSKFWTFEIFRPKKETPNLPFFPPRARLCRALLMLTISPFLGITNSIWTLQRKKVLFCGHKFRWITPKYGSCFWVIPPIVTRKLFLTKNILIFVNLHFPKIFFNLIFTFGS